MRILDALARDCKLVGECHILPSRSLHRSNIAGGPPDRAADGFPPYEICCKTFDVMVAIINMTKGASHYTQFTAAADSVSLFMVFKKAVATPTAFLTSSSSNSTSLMLPDKQSEEIWLSVCSSLMDDFRCV